MIKIARRRTNRGSIGEVPGTIVVDDDALDTSFRAIIYNEGEFSSEEALVAPVKNRIVWQNVVGLRNAEALERTQELYRLHPLVMEDVVNINQRPRAELYENGVFCVLRLFDDTNPKQLVAEQISLFFGDGFVLSFQEWEKDCFDSVRNRLRNSLGRIRKADADYLFYALIDGLIDSYFPILERYEDRFVELERTILEDERQIDRTELYSIRSELRELRRGIWPVHELLKTLIRSEDKFSPMAIPFLRDALDHATRINEQLDAVRESVSALIEFQMTQTGNRMNEIMKFFTIVTSVFVPLSFLTGLYGMNFNTDHPMNLPELSMRYGYVGLWVVMISMSGFMMWVFRRKGWL